MQVGLHIYRSHCTSHFFNRRWHRHVAQALMSMKVPYTSPDMRCFWEIIVRKLWIQNFQTNMSMAVNKE